MDAQLLVVQKLEEKEGVLQSTLAALEKELAVRTQALEFNKRKVRREMRRESDQSYCWLFRFANHCMIW